MHNRIQWLEKVWIFKDLQTFSYQRLFGLDIQDLDWFCFVRILSNTYSSTKSLHRIEEQDYAQITLYSHINLQFDFKKDYLFCGTEIDKKKGKGSVHGANYGHAGNNINHI